MVLSCISDSKAISKPYLDCISMTSVLLLYGYMLHYILNLFLYTDQSWSELLCLSEQLLESFQTSFPTLSFPPLPERGDFDMRDVIESPYFFNWSDHKLLLLSSDTVALYGFTVSVFLCYVDRHRKERGHSLNIICERLEALLTLSCDYVLERWDLSMFTEFSLQAATSRFLCTVKEILYCCMCLLWDMASKLF